MFSSRFITRSVQLTAARNFGRFGKSQTSASEAKTEAVEKSVVVTAKHIKQSPMKMRFLVQLIRNKWFPDASAQMKFTPKPRGADVLKMLKRANHLLRLKYDTIPEELWVKDVITTKGRYQLSARYHGRGGVGMSHSKETQVRITVKVLDIDHEIANAENISQKRKWIKKKQLIEKLKAGKVLEVKTTANSAVANNA